MARVIHNDSSFYPPQYDADGDQRCPSVHAGLNDGHELRGVPNRLVGIGDDVDPTFDSHGVSEDVEVIAPLHYADGQLTLDETRTANLEDGLAAEATARAAADATLASSVASGDSTEATARAAADTALSGRITALEGLLTAGAVPGSYASDAAAASAGVAVGKLYHTTGVVHVRLT